VAYYNVLSQNSYSGTEKKNSLKEVIVAYYNVLSQNSCSGTE